MKGRSGTATLTVFLSIVIGVGSFIYLTIGAKDSILGLGIWLAYASLTLLILWVSDRIMDTLHNREEDSE